MNPERLKHLGENSHSLRAIRDVFVGNDGSGKGRSHDFAMLGGGKADWGHGISVSLGVEAGADDESGLRSKHVPNTGAAA